MQAERAAGGGRARSPEELWAGMVAEIATMPDVVVNLLREHQPDEQGFCAGNGCGTAGRGTPTTRWPCTLHSLAMAAEARRAETAGVVRAAARESVPPRAP